MARTRNAEALIRARLKTRGLSSAARQLLVSNSPDSIVLQLAMTKGQMHQWVPTALLPMEAHSITSRDLRTVIATATVLNEMWDQLQAVFTLNRTCTVVSPDEVKELHHPGSHVYLKAGAELRKQVSRESFSGTSKASAVKVFLDRQAIAERDRFINDKRTDLRNRISESLIATGEAFAELESRPAISLVEASDALDEFDIVSYLADSLVEVSDLVRVSKTAEMRRVEGIADRADLDLGLAALEEASLAIGCALVRIDWENRQRPNPQLAGFNLDANRRSALVSSEDPVAQVDAVSASLRHLGQEFRAEPTFGLRTL